MSKAKRKEDRTAAASVSGAQSPVAAEPLVVPIRSSGRRLPTLSLLLVLLAALLPYLNSLDNGFVLDDHELIVVNPYLKGAAAPGAFFTAEFWDDCNQDRSNRYQPLAMVSFALNHRLGGLEPFGCHLTNLLLHLTICLLLLLALRRLLPRGMLALTATLLFALHPVHTETVSAVGGRAELLAALFLFAAWLVHLAAWPPRDNGSDGFTGGWRHRLGLSLLVTCFFLLALFSTASAMALLPILLLGDLLRQKKAPPPELTDPAEDDEFYTPDRQPVWQTLESLGRQLARLPLAGYAGPLAALAGYLVIRHRTMGSLIGNAVIPYLDNPLAGVDTVERLMTAVKILGEYLRLLIWPFHLSADYSFNQVTLVTSPADPGFLAALAACLAMLVGATVLSRSKRGHVAAFGIFFFFSAIIPVSNIVFAMDRIMAERLLYLPSLGFCLVLASLICLLAREICGSKPGKNGGTSPWSLQSWLVIALVSLIALCYAGRTVSRNPDWHDQQSLFLSAAAVSPNSALVHGDLGVWYFEHGDYTQANRSLERAVAIHPDFPIALYMLGRTRIELGDMERAREALGRVAELRPDHPEIFLALGAVDFRLGRLENATSLFRQTLDLDPENIWAMESLGISLSRRGLYEEAVQVFQSLLEHRPHEANHHFNLATALRSAGRLEEAEAACRKAIELDPDHQGSLITLADICRQTDREKEANTLRDRALRRQP